MDAVECFPPGVPRVYLHPFPMEIVQTPGRVLLIYEFNHFTADFHGWTKAFDRRQLRECATGDYMDPFADWLKSAGFRRRSAQLLLRGAAHLGEWAAIEQVRIEQFDQRVLDTFAGHLATCCCTHPFRGGDRRNLRGAKRCIEHLQIRGITAFAEHEARPLPVMVDAFNGWMRRHRGATESTIALYASIVLKKGCGLRW